MSTAFHLASYTGSDDEKFAKALADVSANGGTLYIPAGTYKLTRPLFGPDPGVICVGGSGPTLQVVDVSGIYLNLYEVEIESFDAATGTGTFKWKLLPESTYRETGKPFRAGDVVSLTETAPDATGALRDVSKVNIIFPSGAYSVNDPRTPQNEAARYQWRGGGVNSVATVGKTVILQGAGRETSVLEFNFNATGGKGDGLVTYWHTRAQSAVGTRIADLHFVNVSRTNKCGLPSRVPGSFSPPATSPPPDIVPEGTPINHMDRYRIEITTGGGRGSGLFTYKRHPDFNASLPVKIPQTVPHNGKFEIPGSGVTVTFPDVTYESGQYWEFKPTGYGGSAILNVGGGDVQLERVVTTGWMIGLNIDGGIANHVKHCTFKPHSRVRVTELENVGVLIANKNQYRLDASHLSTILSLEDIRACGRYGVLDFGGYNHRFVQMQFTACKTCMFFMTGGPFHVINAYHESNEICHYETDYTGQIVSLILEDCYFSNRNAIPLLFNRGLTYFLKLQNILMVGTPTGTHAHSYGLEAGENTVLIHDQPDFSRYRFGFHVVEITNWMIVNPFQEILPPALLSDTRVRVLEDVRSSGHIRYYRVSTP